MRKLALLVAVFLSSVFVGDVSAQNPPRICTGTSCLRNSGTDLCFDAAVGTPCEAQLTTTGWFKLSGCVEVGGLVGSGSCICRESSSDRLYADKDCDGLPKEVGEEYLDNSGGPGGEPSPGDKFDLTVDATGLIWTIKPNSVEIGTDTTGNYAAGDAEAGACLTGDSATAFFSTGTVDDARVSGEAESDEVQGGGSTYSVSGVTIPTDFKYGIQSALASFVDESMMYTWVYDPVGSGPNEFVTVPTLYTIGTLPTCNAAALGSIQYVTDAGGCAGPPDTSGICRCQVTDPGDDAAGGATPSFGWREMYPTPAVWLASTSGGAGGYAALNVDSQAHFPAYRVDLYEPTAGACQQIIYLAGRGDSFPVWGRAGVVEQMLIALGYAGESDSTRAFWGWTRLPTAVVMNPAASDQTTALQNFTDGFGYIYWGGTNQFYGVSRRASSSNVFTMGSGLDLSNGTNRTNWQVAHMKGMVTTSTSAEFINTTTWNAQFKGKLGFPFLMASHGSASPPDSNWVVATTSSNVPSFATANNHELRPLVVLCKRPGASGDAQLFLHKAALAAAVYDYD